MKKHLILFTLAGLMLTGCFKMDNIEVKENKVEVTDVTLNKATLNLNVGASETLKATIHPSNATNQNILWQTSDNKVATVDGTGLVTAIVQGTATIWVTTVDGAKTATCTVTVTTPPPSPLFGDGSWYKYYSKTTGPGIDLVFMGDGYTVADLNGGKYESDMKRGIDGFFAVYPYSKYKSYFNAYIIGAVSNVSGIGTDGVPKDTRFKAFHGEGTNMDAENMDDCIDLYAEKIPGVNRFKSAIVLIANSTKHGGTNWLYYYEGVKNKAYQVAICPSTSDLAAIVQHEAGGHGFGWLGDEYWNEGSGLISNDRKDRLTTFQNLGFHLNVSITNDPATVFWKDFIGKSKYSMVGFYEGAYLFEKGAWRSENHSCMRWNDPYFNAPSRYLIVKRIKELAGESFSMEWFLANDDFALPTRSYSIDVERRRQLPPLAPPVMVAIR